MGFALTGDKTSVSLCGWSVKTGKRHDLSAFQASQKAISPMAFGVALG